ncbi:RbtT/DalT/CsbX family MFS transporter [Enemella evansiae]|uniref:Arabinose ABC transporter permease n=1 Tax=Enemella evansiae TaxID=2016499 RepID=A0A255GBK5_9ACTN|nr:RbtT/DalT/CsbX family MFS transporter [Enemella evansiae]OYN96216.1 arabinose ABC transporter permease [Enemella evansiae]OYN99565.1 arabinose ABC transporter permease [Enemella evansiae]OYO06839.1 arabinose ABC transporter permease [Enemella evansiae]OYO11087.1 arabinose ABC transporter permease [Enemella evansiae]OYO12842.1 arabinose ABC transporter permease [Enemella evansiae]
MNSETAATSTTTAHPDVKPYGSPDETRWDRLGIPDVLKWGFIGLLIFMTGNGVESNFITPHMVAVLGSPEATVSTIITGYSLAVLVGSYLGGALSDLWGPRRVMLLGFLVWVVFEALFLISLSIGSVPLTAITYTLRGFGYPLFAFAFLVWINITAPVQRNGTAVGWFYVMFTGGLPTLGSLFALGVIPTFGGGTRGETAAMIGSIGLVVIGYLVARFGVRATNGVGRIAPPEETTGQVLTAGVRLTARHPKILMGFLVRLINTAPQYGMFIILPTVIAVDLGWGQSRWLSMTVAVYATNILVNAVFGAVGDRWGWRRTVRWFGVFGSACGLLLWWYVPHWVPAGSTWGFLVSVVAGCVFGCLLAGFVPMGAIMPALTPEHKGAAMAMYTTAAGGAAFLGAGVVALVLNLGNAMGWSRFATNSAVVWAFVALYAAAFVMVGFLKVPQDEKGARQH